MSARPDESRSRRIETVGLRARRAPRGAAGGAAGGACASGATASARPDGDRRAGARNTKMLVAGDPVPLERAFGQGARRRHARPARCHEPQEAGRAEGPGRAVSFGPQPSASYCFTMRIELRQRPGSFARWRTRSASRGRDPRRDRPRARRRDGSSRDVTVACVDAAHGERVVAAVRALDGVKVHERLGPHVPDAPRRQDRGRTEGPDQDPRRPVDGLHARRGARVDRRSTTTRQGADADDQAQHRRGRHRRDRGARARRHRAGGGACR